ncbi:protein Star-like [Folsomia candida]|nr:protein Star-like [Folsomia candida]
MTGWTYMNGWGAFLGNEGDYRSFEAQCFPLYSILRAINVTTVDYFSLDIEGAELSVLKTIPWEAVLIKTLSIEVRNKTDEKLKDYMKSVGFQFVRFLKNGFSHDHIYAHSSITLSN